MASKIFYEEKKTFKTPFKSFLKLDTVLGLKDYIIWAGFNNGHWVTYDFRKHETKASGKIEGDLSKLVHIFRKPKVLDNETIVYINKTELKLHTLNPYTSDIDKSWGVDVPTLSVLSQTEKADQEKAQDTLDDAEMLVLENSRTVILMERKDQMNNNSDYIVSAFKQPKKEAYATTQPLNSQMKKMYLSKVNEDDTICIYSDYAHPKMKFYLWNINKIEEGWTNYEFDTIIATTLVFCGGWEQGKIIFLGNPDQGVPEAYVCQYEPYNKEALEIVKIDNLRNKEVMLADCVFHDPKTKRLLVQEIGCELYKVATLYNFEKKKFEFFKNIAVSDEIHTLSHDKKYFIGYSPRFISDESLEIHGETHLNVNIFVNRKVWVIHLMKKAKINVEGKNVSLLDYFGSPFLAQHVADLLK